MNAAAVVVDLEFLELLRQIERVPKQRLIKMFTPDRSD
jgi:hypothetical protein